MNTELTISNEVYNWTVGLYLDASKGASLSTDQNEINNYKSIEHGCKDIFGMIKGGKASNSDIINTYIQVSNMYKRLTQNNCTPAAAADQAGAGGSSCTGE